MTRYAILPYIRALSFHENVSEHKSEVLEKIKFFCASYAGVAQLVEQLICNQQVAGSSPIASSILGPIDRTDGLDFVERCPSGQREQTVNLPANAFEGSNPSLSTSLFRGLREDVRRAGVAQLVEHQPSKLRVAGSSPVPRSIFRGKKNENQRLKDTNGLINSAKFVTKRVASRAHVAQSVEHFLGKEEVIGSNPIVGSSMLSN